MKRLLLVFLFLILLFPAKASHIVGGEFELIHLTGYTYQVNLILYFDLHNGSIGAKDPSVTARIFRMSDDGVMMDLFLPLISEEIVVYSQPECSIGELETLKLIYSTTIFLNPGSFNDPLGYYLSWQRCCRNYNIDNIFSDDPNGFGQFAGQTFYLEFPPVEKNGLPFINSSPRLFPPLSDYACKDKPYYVDFTGTDDDGDSLAYSLVTPLNTLTSNALPLSGFPFPKPSPNPYPDIVWRSPYSFNNIMGGSPDLQISDDGLLTVTPQETGLFVFAVKCEEFREGIKIGEVRRDFQMLSVECRTAVPPVIRGKKLLDPNFTYKDNMVVTFDHGTTDQNRCIEVKISDKDINNAFDSFKERVKIRAVGIGNKKSIDNVTLPQVKAATLTLQDSIVTFKICFVECPLVQEPYTIGIIASDDACALPLLDTLKITINPTPNKEPYFSTVDVNEVMEEGEPIMTWPVIAVDEDNDPITFTVLTEPGVSLSNVGMSFNVIGQVQETLSANFSWDPKCDIYNFRRKTEFEIKIVANGTCISDTMRLNLSIKLPQNNPPVLDNTLGLEKRTIEITKKVYETVNFDVLGNDVDDDFLTLDADGLDFSLLKYGATFPQREGDGSVNSQFNWFINCNSVDLQEKSDFEFRFLVVDSTNYCHVYKADTLDLVVHVEPPDNEAPQLTITSDNTIEVITEGTLNIILGDSIALILTGVDGGIVPKDLLKIELLSQTGNVEPKGYIFNGGEGEGPLVVPFTWNPDCSIFENRVYENSYTFKFLLADNRCFNTKSDTVSINIIIKDVDGGDQDFLPPNVFTPNGDSKNEFFGMVKESETSGELVSILPEDNCIGEFLAISIYNRWGKQVYRNSNRDFHWYGEGMPVGVYYYLLKYSNKEYKGTVSIQF